MIYGDIVERILQGVRRVRPDVLRAALTMQIDAAFPQISREVAEEFAGRERYRPLMRRTFGLTFAAGVASIGTGTVNDVILKKYMVDAKLTVTVVAGDPPLVFDYIDSADYDRTHDPRLGKWKYEGFTGAITAEMPADSEDGSVPLEGAAFLNCLVCPAVPTSPSQAYEGLPDMLPELIDAGIQFFLGQTANKAADET